MPTGILEYAYCGIVGIMHKFSGSLIIDLASSFSIYLPFVSFPGTYSSNWSNVHEVVLKGQIQVKLAKQLTMATPIPPARKDSGV